MATPEPSTPENASLNAEEHTSTSAGADSETKAGHGQGNTDIIEERRSTGTPEVSTDVVGDLEIPQSGMPTLGGMQFWGDVRFLQGWKIQENVLTGHFRLLNPDQRRFASGSREVCDRMLEAVSRKHRLKPDVGRAVIVLHGIGRSSRSFADLSAALRRDGFVVVPFEYPSTRIPLEQSAEYLHEVIQSMPSVTSIDFVVHSMGGLVLRSYLASHSDARLHRAVMMGTPNSGAELADMLHRNTIYRIVYGPAGQQLVTHEDGTIPRLPLPPFEVGIIAGGNGTDRGYNPILPGDNDGTVTIASARLPGAKDFLRIPRLHSFLMSDPVAIDSTCRFLREGRFCEE
ncbi:MAG: hypothetical protein KDA96_19535 [Planctomycetaceae bacterium]|nr:hypothetical protein [Planctomycetaceae bacterium]